jgi:hypothetical protein
MGASIAFLHPADLGGVLTELVQFREPLRMIPQSGGLGGLTRMDRIENSEGPANATQVRVVCQSPAESRTRMLTPAVKIPLASNV